MKKYNVPLSIVVLSVMFCNVSGMENEQKLPMITRKATACALSKLLFNDNEKILHIGSHCEKMIREKASRAQVYCIDINTLSMMQVPVIKYDKVLTFACWDVAKKPFDIFVDSARVLKSHGKFCAALPYYDSPYIAIYHQTFTNNTWKEFYDTHKETKICGSREIKRLLTDAGLGNNVRCAIITKPFVFKTKEKFMAWVASYLAELDGIIPHERQMEFINDVVTQYLQQYPVEKDHSVKLYLPYMVVSGYKS